ncbi:hypothetical protein THIOKS1260003 [Thiocapsa sp. KS1]|nr:hypothetical protein THIOKS1260003 [Thiocapsa sp. KS1]
MSPDLLRQRFDRHHQQLDLRTVLHVGDCGELNPVGHAKVQPKGQGQSHGDTFIDVFRRMILLPRFFER